MAWVVYYCALLAAFILASILPHAGHHAYAPDLIRTITSCVTLLSALGQAIAKVNLRFYLLWQRAWVWWHSDRSSLWRFGIRMDGPFETETVLELIKQAFGTELVHWDPKLIAENGLNIHVRLDRTIHLQITYEPSTYAGDGVDHLTIRSDELEVSYGSSRSKIDSVITPLLSALIRVVRPREYSAMFDIFFENHNPFFAFYIAHLKPEQVSQFNILFYPRSSLEKGRTKIHVMRDQIQITAGTTESFAQLAKGMLLLSADSLKIIEV